MNVTKCINELLYEYDCVIVPDFGGFITRERSSQFDPMQYTFQPPFKTVGFNPFLKESDALLINALAKKYDVSYAQASEWIKTTVQKWITELHAYGELTLTDLGTLRTEKGKLHFTALPSHNFSVSSFGFSPIQAHYLATETTEEKTKNKSHRWMSYAAAIGLALSVGSASFWVNDQVIQKQLSSIIPLLSVSQANSPQKIETSNTTPVVSAIPSSTTKEREEKNAVTTTEEEVTNVQFYVIGGSFRNEKRAHTFLAELKKSGYETALILPKKGKFHPVAYQHFNTKDEAIVLKRKLEKAGIDTFIRDQSEL